MKLKTERENRPPCALTGLCLVVAVLIALTKPGLCGSADAPQASSQSSQPRQIAPIPTAEIALRAQQTIKRLQEIEGAIRADSTISAIDRDLPLFTEMLERWWKAQAADIARAGSVLEISDALHESDNFKVQIETWEKAASRRSEQQALLQNAIEQSRAIWRATQLAAKRQRLAKPIQERVDDVVKEAGNADLLLKERIAKLLELQNRIADKRKLLVEIDRRIEKAREEFGANLLTIDSPSLWQSLTSAAVGESLRVQANEGWRRVEGEVRTFFEARRDRLPIHGALLLAIFVVLYLIRYAGMQDSERKDDLALARKILSFVFSSAFFIMLAVASLLYQRAAGDILRGIALLAVIPVLRFIPVLFSNAWRGAMYFIVCLYLVEFFRELFPPGWALARLLLLALDLVAVGYAVALLRYGKGAILSLGRREALARLSLSMVSALLVISIAGNLVGNLSLAEFLTTATVRVAYLALLLYSLVELLIAVVSLGLKTRAAQISLLVRAHGELLSKRCATILRFAAGALWLMVVSYIFGFLGGLFSGGTSLLTRRWKVGATEVSLDELATFVSVVVVAWLLSRMIRFVFKEEIVPRIRLPRGVPGAVDMLSNYFILLFGFILALAAAGIDLSKITLVLSALGVGLGFGLQNIVSNFVSGLILAFEHPIQVGDTLEVGSLLGKVQRLGFRASVIRTFDGAEVIIPNGELVWGQVINWSLSDRIRRIEVSVGVAYGTDPNRVLEILRGVAEKHQAVLRYPLADALFEQFGDSSLDFKLRCWVSVDDFYKVRSELAVGINDAFKQGGITIPFPQRDLHIDWPETNALPRDQKIDD
jgi:potassium-dependent mechanosensitive channel